MMGEEAPVSKKVEFREQVIESLWKGRIIRERLPLLPRCRPNRSPKEARTTKEMEQTKTKNSFLFAVGRRVVAAMSSQEKKSTHPFPLFFFFPSQFRLTGFFHSPRTHAQATIGWLC